MKGVLFAALLACALPATAQQMGFFHQNDYARAAPFEGVKATDGAACSVVVRYNVPQPTWLLLTYSNLATCGGTAVAAMDSAYRSVGEVAKDTLSTESRPAQPGVWDCTITVGWDPSGSVIVPAITPAVASCSSSTPTAMHAAMRAARCLLTANPTYCEPLD